MSDARSEKARAATGLDRRLFRRESGPLASDVSLIASEFLAGFQAVQRIDRPAVSIFGSARVKDGSAAYDVARRTGRCFAEEGFAGDRRTFPVFFGGIGTAEDS